MRNGGQTARQVNDMLERCGRGSMVGGGPGLPCRFDPAGAGPPWVPATGVDFLLDVGPGLIVGYLRREEEGDRRTPPGVTAPERYLGVDRRSGGWRRHQWRGRCAHCVANEETCELRAAAGALCSSYKADIVALCTAINRFHEQPPPDEKDPIVIWTDYQAALRRLQSET